MGEAGHPGPIDTQFDSTLQAPQSLRVHSLSNRYGLIWSYQMLLRQGHVDESRV